MSVNFENREQFDRGREHQRLKPGPVFVTTSGLEIRRRARPYGFPPEVIRQLVDAGQRLSKRRQQAAIQRQWYDDWTGKHEGHRRARNLARWASSAVLLALGFAIGKLL